MIERLILALGLGSSGWDTTPNVPISNCRKKKALIRNYNLTTNNNNIIAITTSACRFFRDTEKVCHQWTEKHSEFNIAIQWLITIIYRLEYSMLIFELCYAANLYIILTLSITRVKTTE